MKQHISVAVATLILVLSGVVHGLMSDRWGLPTRVIDAANQLSQVPATVGEWSSQDLEVSERTMQVSGAQGILSRIYTHRPTGSSVNVLIVVGRPGPVAEHPPTICFTSAGFQLSQPPRKENVSDENGKSLGEFWMGDFTKSTELVPEHMRTFWGWNAGDKWEASDNPRMQYAPNPLLYKLYVSRSLVRAGEGINDKDLAIQFMRLLLPELQKTFFEAGPQQASSETSTQDSTNTN